MSECCDDDFPLAFSETVIAEDGSSVVKGDAKEIVVGKMITFNYFIKGGVSIHFCEKILKCFLFL